MLVLVLYRHGQPLSQLIARPSLLGNTLLGRVRSMTFAMLGATTAVGLCLVAFILNQGWPSVFGGPIPGFPGERSHVAEATSAPPPASNGGTAFGRGPTTAASATEAVPDRPGRPGSRLSGSNEVEGPAPASPSPTAPQPSGGGAPPVEGAAPPPAATPTPPAATSAPTTASPPSTQASAAGSSDKGKGEGKSKDKGKESSSTSESHAKAESSPAAKGKSASKAKSASKGKSRSSKPRVEPSPAKQSTPAPVVEPAGEDAVAAEKEKKDKSGSSNGNAYGHYK
jgi:hypothetical protein